MHFHNFLNRNTKLLGLRRLVDFYCVKLKNNDIKKFLYLKPLRNQICVIVRRMRPLHDPNSFLPRRTCLSCNCTLYRLAAAFSCSRE